MQVADRELVAHIAHRVFEIQNGKILGETAAA